MVKFCGLLIFYRFFKMLFFDLSVYKKRVVIIINDYIVLIFE